MFKVTIRKIGNSYGVILPQALLRHLRLGPGDDLTASPDAHRIVLEPTDDIDIDIDAIVEDVFDRHDRMFEELAK